MAIIISLLILALYGALTYQHPQFSLLTPRGGILGVAAALALGNGLLWGARHLDISSNMRLQLLLAGWIWLLVQLGGVLYLYLTSN